MAEVPNVALSSPIKNSFWSLVLAFGIDMEKKASISHTTFVNGVFTHYDDIVSFLRPWEEIPFHYLVFPLSTIDAKRRGEDYKQILARKPTSTIGIYHRYSACSHESYSLPEALSIIRDRSTIYRIHFNSFHIAHHYNFIRIRFQHFLINAHSTNKDLYDWYVLHLSLGETSIPQHVEEAVKDLEGEGIERNLFYIRQRNEEEFSKISQEELEEETLDDRMKSAPMGAPHSLMAEIFLDGWEAKYHLARRMSPMNVLSLLPILFWEGKFDEILHLTQQRVPYTEEDMTEFLGFGIPDEELKSIIGEDRPLLCLPLEKSILAIEGDSKDLDVKGIKDEIRSHASKVLDVISGVELWRSSMILRGINHEGIVNILKFFIHGQIVMATKPEDMDRKFLSNLVEKRNDMAERFASVVRLEESIFAECCLISEDSCLLVDGDYYRDNNLNERVKVMREKAVSNIQGRLFHRG